MGVQKLINQNVRKITKLGGKSLAVTLPRELVVELGWKEKQKVVVKKKGSKLIISDWKPKGR
ncbi:MAG: AbrB/MazE/SpoVT family DNA-binding domain-containing protein [Candidatus Paceibacterota bacterium]|jgi:antitoxin component of MazEF toxin-antitoxin module